MLDNLIKEIETLADAEHNKLGDMLLNYRDDRIACNWQGGRVNGIRTVLQMLYDMQDKESKV